MVLAASGPSRGSRQPSDGLRHGGNTRVEGAGQDLPLRVGIVNIMPRAETYESHVLRPLARAILAVSPVWIRLRSHTYGSSDSDHIERRYVAFEDALRQGPLDGLILTGAPVEELEFHEVHYWGELVEILRFCRSHVPSVLGVCWGGLALAKLLDIEKYVSRTKVFGVFQNRNLVPDHPILGGADDLFWCVHSRHSGIRDADLEAARDAGVVRLLAHGPDTGYSIFESSDRRFLMHLGHPEYGASRLREEWERDASLGRRDVERPRNFDLERPSSVWRSHCNDLFAQWLRDIATGRP